MNLPPSLRLGPITTYGALHQTVAAELSSIEGNSKVPSAEWAVSSTSNLEGCDTVTDSGTTVDGVGLPLAFRSTDL